MAAEVIDGWTAAEKEFGSATTKTVSWYAAMRNANSRYQLAKISCTMRWCVLLCTRKCWKLFTTAVIFHGSQLLVLGCSCCAWSKSQFGPHTDFICISSCLFKTVHFSQICFEVEASERRQHRDAESFWEHFPFLSVVGEIEKRVRSIGNNSGDRKSVV